MIIAGPQHYRNIILTEDNSIQYIHLINNLLSVVRGQLTVVSCQLSVVSRKEWIRLSTRHG